MSTKYQVGEIVTFQGRTGRIVEARKNDQGDRVVREQMRNRRDPGQWVSNLGTGSDDMYLLDENLYLPDPMQEFTLENCGPLKNIQWPVSPAINLIIGENGSGKSLLLKVLYAALRSTETYTRGDTKHNFQQILSKKLLDTFSLNHLGKLVGNAGDSLRFESKFAEQRIHFSFTPSATQQFTDVAKNIKPRLNALSQFLPPKEILSLIGVIQKSRLQDNSRAFDDTYLDLAVALDGDMPQVENPPSNLVQIRDQLSKIYQGRIVRIGGDWQFEQDNTTYPIHITAEGIKRLESLYILLGNRSLTPSSVLFIDEPEATLHPKAIRVFMDILYLLCSQGTQIFMASHSYFVLKSLYIIAKRENVNIQVLALTGDSQPTIENLMEGIPDNPIIDESIALYEREIDAELSENSAELVMQTS